MMKLPQKKIMEALKTDENQLMILADIKKLKSLEKEHLVTEASVIVNAVFDSFERTIKNLSKELGLNFKLKTILTIKENKDGNEL